MSSPNPLPDEFALIARLFAPLARDFPGAFGLLDDAAAISHAPGEEIVITKDLLVGGVHFLTDDPAPLIARKLLRVNLSDLAAKGARPVGYLLGLTLPKTISYAWLEGFAAGLAADQVAFGVSLIGGDTTAAEAGPLVLSLTAFGTLARGTMVHRAGARVGDLIYVSGTIGDGALGLLAATGRLAGLPAGLSEQLIARYRLPEPRIALGLKLPGLAHAGMDISDGLLGDLGHLCAVSGVGAEITLADLPLSNAARAALSADPDLLNLVVSGGDDYELLFCVAPNEADRVGRLARECGIMASPIGKIVAGQGVIAKRADGSQLTPKQAGFRHF
jgi:thiamine-monophosphate kinase